MRSSRVVALGAGFAGALVLVQLGPAARGNHHRGRAGDCALQRQSSPRLRFQTGKQLWDTKVERNINANGMTYQGKNGKQYVSAVATDSVVAYALP